MGNNISNRVDGPLTNLTEPNTIEFEEIEETAGEVYDEGYNRGDMPQCFLQQEDIADGGGVVARKKFNKTPRLLKRRSKRTRRVSVDDLSDMERYGEHEMIDDGFDDDGFEDDFALDIDPLNRRRIRIDLRNLAELPNEGGDRMVPLNLIGDDDILFNMLHFDFSFADAATNSGDMPHDFLEDEELEGVCILSKHVTKKEKQYKRRSRMTISASSDNIKLAKKTSNVGIPMKNSSRSKSCLSKKLRSYRPQSDVSMRRRDFG